MSVSKQQLLETITTISKLILLSFKPIGTKIAIREHKLVVCDPINTKYYINSTITQGIDRCWNNDSREDMYVLNHVIVNFIELYVQPYKSKDPIIYENLIKLSKYLCVGLKRLQRTYGSCNVSLVLQYYVNVLMTVISETYCNDMLFNLSKNHDNDETQAPTIDRKTLEYSTMLDIDKITNFWSDEEIKSIADQFGKCFKEHNEKESDLFNLNDMFDNSIQTIFPQQLSSTSSSSGLSQTSSSGLSSQTLSQTFSNSLDDIKLPVPKNKTSALINGYLVGIEKILELMDDKFSALLDKSVNGTK